MESPFLYVSPAFAGYVAALLLMAPALDGLRKKGEQGKGWAIVLAVIPATSPMFAFIGAFVLGPSYTDPMPLVVLGAAAAATAILQGLIGRSQIPKLDPADPAPFGKLLVRYVLPEVLVLAGFIYAFLMVPQP